MEIKYSANCGCGATVKRFIPFAIVCTGDSVYIDKNHPHAQELAEIADEMFNHMEWLSDDDFKGYKLLDRVGKLTGSDVAAALQFAWADFRDSERKKAAAQTARAFVTQLAAMDPDERVAYDADLLKALCAIGNERLPSISGGGLLAVFAYGYQCGAEAAK